MFGKTTWKKRTGWLAMLLMLAMVFSPAWMRTTGAVDVSKDAK